MLPPLPFVAELLLVEEAAAAAAAASCCATIAWISSGVYPSRPWRSQTKR